MQIHLCCENQALVRSHVDADGCLYCYANYDRKSVEENRKRHDVNSPLLTGHLKETDHVKEAQQKSFKDTQMRLFL